MQPMPGPPPPPQGWPMGPPQPSTDSKSVVALVLGIVSVVGSFCWLGLPLGIAAIVFGTLAHRDIRRSDGLTGGRGMATAGIALGAVGSAVFAGMVTFFIIALTSASSAVAPPPPPSPTLPPTAVTAAPITPPGGWGSIHVVELHPGDPLSSQLVGELKAARAAGETVLVETTASACTACGEIARAMREPPLQAALTSVRLVLLDVREVTGELPALGMSQPTLPWFYLVDAHGNARDGISADEWDDNDAESIAPIVDAFVRGRLRSRHHPWRGTTL